MLNPIPAVYALSLHTYSPCIYFGVYYGKKKTKLNKLKVPFLPHFPLDEVTSGSWTCCCLQSDSYILTKAHSVCELWPSPPCAIIFHAFINAMRHILAFIFLLMSKTLWAWPLRALYLGDQEIYSRNMYFFFCKTSKRVSRAFLEKHEERKQNLY